MTCKTCHGARVVDVTDRLGLDFGAEHRVDDCPDCLSEDCAGDGEDLMRSDGDDVPACWGCGEPRHGGRCLEEEILDAAQ